jgi:acyl-CoA synthetase (AMP-forming)/AMP-acid ligase II
MKLRAIAEKNPDKAAIIMTGSGIRISYAQLDQQANQGAQLFRQLGLKKGDHIALVMENHPQFLPLCWAALRAGLYFTAISHRLQPQELLYIVEDCGARVVVGSSEQAQLLFSLPAACPDITFFMLDKTIEGFNCWETALTSQPISPIDDETVGSDMLYSSGTTGRPKGIKLPLDNDEFGTGVSASLFLVLNLLWGFDTDTRYLSPAPLYHAAPLRFCLNTLRHGGTVVVMERFDAEAALQAIERYQITHSQWVPTMFVKMLKLPAHIRALYAVSSMKVALHAAAPCPIKIKQQMIEWWGEVIHEYYSGTEGIGFTVINATDWLQHPGSVGRPLNAQVHITDDEGNELPVGETGNVFFSTQGSFAYHNDPQKTRQAYDRNGWATFGDVGYCDQEGFLYLTDRKSYMIISGGVNIYPQETEDCLITHPAVADAAVFGIPDEEFGEQVKAVVQLLDHTQAGPAMEQQLIDFCRAHIAHYKCPKSIDFEQELPRHPTGKLYKRLLKDKYATVSR